MSSKTSRYSSLSHPLRNRSSRRASGPTGLAGLLLLAVVLTGCGTGVAVLPAGLPAVAGGFFSVETVVVVDAVVGRPYLNRLRTRGATPPISSCSVISGNLPAGLSVQTGSVATPSDPGDDDTCVIIGVPTAAGTAVFEIEMRDSSFALQRATQGYTMRVRPEFEIASFSVVDAIAGRDYNNSFTVTTNVSNNPDPDELDSAEAGNGPLTGCVILGLPASVGSTCIINAGGTTVDVTLTNTGVLAAGGSTAFTIALEDNPILQDGVGVVPAIPVTNQTNSTPFALSFTVRPEFSITNALPAMLPDGTGGGPYSEDIAVSTNLSNSGTEVGRFAEFGNGPITNCEATNLPAGLSSSFVLAGGGTGCIITVSGTITEPQGDFKLTVEVTDSNITQTAVVVAVNTLSLLDIIDLAITGPLQFFLATVDSGTTTACTGGTFTDASAAAPDAVKGRTYGTPRCDLLFTATGGVAPMVWNFSAPGMPELVCTQGGVGNRLLRCNTAGNPVGLAAATDDLTVDVTDNNSTNVTADINAHAAHTIVVRDAFTFILDPAVDPPPPGVNGRNYGNTAASNCGATETDACLALVYTAAGGFTPYSFAPLPASQAAPNLVAPGATPAAVACAAGAATVTCTSGASNVTAAVGNYPFTVRVTDAAGNDSTPGNVSIPRARSIDIFAALAVVLESPTDPPPVGVNGRTYGNDLVLTCSGGACAPLLYRAAGGLGDPTVNASYDFTFATGETDAPAAGFPAGIACNPGLNPDADELTCAALAGIAVNTTGTFTPAVDVDDIGNATTPAGATATTGPKNLVVNPELSFELVTAPVDVGPFVAADPIPQGAAGRTWADLLGAGNALVFKAFAATGLGSFTWDAVTDPLPGAVACGIFSSGAAPGDETACFQELGPTATAGLFPINVTLRDLANASTPAGFTSTDNLGHFGHTIIINTALMVDSVTPLNSAVTGSPYANQLLGSGGITATHAWTHPALMAFANDPGGDCGTLAMSAAGAIAGTPAIVTDNSCNFSVNLNDAGNALTPSSAASGTGDLNNAMSIPISAAGGPSIDNVALINGLNGFDYFQSFTATGGAAAFVWTGPTVQCGPLVGGPTPSGTLPTGTAVTTVVDDGLLSGPASPSGVFNFGVCLTDSNDAFSLRNYTVTINPAHVLVTNSGDDDVERINTATDASVGTVTVGDDPRSVDVSRDGTRAAVANFGDLSLTLFDTLTGGVLNTFSSASSSVGVVFSHDGAFAYVTDTSDNVVRKIDLATGAEVASIPVGNSPRGIAINRNTIANASVGAINGAPGTRAFVANSGDDNVSVINLDTNAVVATIAVGDQPHGVSFDPASNRVFVTNFGGNSYSMYNILTGTVTTKVLTDITAAATGPQGIVVTPDGQHLYVATEGGTVEVYNIVNNTDDTTPPDPANTFVASINPAGTNNLQGIDTTVDRLKTYAADFANDTVVPLNTDPTSGGFNTAGTAILVGTDPQAEHGVRVIPYPVLHFTLAETGGVRILAQGDDDTVDYEDFIRVLGGVPPYAFADGDAGGAMELSDDTDCNGIGLTSTTGRISGNPNPGGGAGPKVCEFIIRVTDSADVPQTIQGTFRLTITEE